MSALLAVELRREHDVVLARQRARQVASLLGFELQDGTRLSTAVSEMARNAFQYAGGGRVEFAVRAEEPAALVVKIVDHGPGIADLEAILAGRYRSPTGLGLGILGARRLMDEFAIESVPGSFTLVVLARHLPRAAPPPTPERAAWVAQELAQRRPADPLSEIQQQNQELLATLDELRRERARIAQVNAELEETNRGVVALYAELDERAQELQRASEIKTRFLSNMTHEFRTPLNSITSLTRILLQKLDGDLTTEQEKQVRFIQRSADSLSELVNDLLDLAKAEAGKIAIRPSEFQVEGLFGTLRGIMRPLLAQGGAVELVFEDASALPPLRTDESKVSQILRNFISNALKYTERGTVRVSARLAPGDAVVFEVSDTGIGIAPEDRGRIFQEYGQLDHPLQLRSRGTGLGLPLSRRLAGLLGGGVGVESTPGEGSTFYAILPIEYRGPTDASFEPERRPVVDPGRLPVLVLEDSREPLAVYQRLLEGTRYQVLPARSVAEARGWLRTARPAAVVLDLLLDVEPAWAFIGELRARERGRALPVVVVAMADDEARARRVGADAFHAKPVDRAGLVGTLDRLVRERPVEKVLVIDDDEVSRYLLRGLLAETRFGLVEARSGREGLLLAREERPRAIFLDLVMEGADGFTVLQSLGADERTRNIPVFIHTSRQLDERDRARLASAAAIVPKGGASRDAQLAAVRSALREAGLVAPESKERS